MENREKKWQNHLDRIIEEARERGEFDLRDKKGKPLEEERHNVYAGDKAMAYKILANSGHAPDFLMKKREIDEMLNKERTRLLRYARRRERLLTAADQAADETAAAALRLQAAEEWQWAIGQFEKEVPELNRQIDIFNLMNKIPNLHKLRIRLEHEVERIEKQVREEEGA